MAHNFDPSNLCLRLTEIGDSEMRDRRRNDLSPVSKIFHEQLPLKREVEVLCFLPSIRLHTILLAILTCAQRTRVYFCPQHWLLCHLGLY